MAGRQLKIVKTSILTLISLILLQVNTTHGQDCQKLPDGKYRVKFDKQFGGVSYKLQLEGDRFIQLREGEETQGTVEINESCTLLLDYKIKWDTTNELQRVLSKSRQPAFIFETTQGKRLRFRLTGYAGPHVTSGEGTFIKLN